MELKAIFDIKNADSGNDSYLKPSTASWTANRSGDKTAYITKAVFFADDYGKSYDSESDVYNYGVRPMLTIKGNLLLVSGDGSFDDPYYVVKEKKAKGGSLVNTRRTGEYIKTGGMIWRIVGVTDDGLTKVISNDTLSCTGERVVLYSADKDGVLNYNPKEKQNVGYYINNQATKCFDADDFSIHEISVPLYKKEIIYGQEVETKKYKVKFSAPNMYDMFSAQPNEYDGHTTHSYWLVNSSKSKMMQGVIYDIGIPENKTIEYRLNSIDKSIEELKSYIIETKMQQKDIDLLYKTLEQLETKNEVLSNRIDALEKKPIGHWNNIVSTIISTLFGGLILFILYKLGLGI